jgi:hypothetical protein
MDEELLLSNSCFDADNDLASDCFGNHGVLIFEHQLLTSPAPHKLQQFN